MLCTLILGVVVSTWQAVRATRAEHEQSRLGQEAEGLRANEARLLRREAEEARRNEAVLRQQAETRENLAKAQLLCQQLRFDEAEALLSRIPAPALQSERRDAASDPSGEWFDWLIARILLREATALIDVQPSGS